MPHAAVTRTTATARLTAALSVGACLCPTLARAGAAASDDRARAEALFNEGKATMDAGDLAHACEKFAASQSLDPQLGTLLNLATCEEAIGKRAAACALWQQAVEIAAHKQAAEREAFARERGDQLCGALPKLTIEVADQALKDQMVVTINGVRLERPHWGEPMVVDPGAYDVRAASEGRVSWSAQGWLDERGSAVVQVPVLATEAPRFATAPPQVRATPREKTFNAASWISVGVGLTAVGVGSAFGVAALASQASSNGDRRCVGNVCNEDGARARSRAIDEAHIADISFAVGAGALATGFLLWVFTPRENANAAWSIRPSLARDSWSLTWQDAWP